jgi:hypothetical protein
MEISEQTTKEIISHIQQELEITKYVKKPLNYI